MLPFPSILSFPCVLGNEPGQTHTAITLHSQARSFLYTRSIPGNGIRHRKAHKDQPEQTLQMVQTVMALSLLSFLSCHLELLMEMAVCLSEPPFLLSLSSVHFPEPQVQSPCTLGHDLAWRSPRTSTQPSRPEGPGTDISVCQVHRCHFSEISKW